MERLRKCLPGRFRRGAWAVPAAGLLAVLAGVPLAGAQDEGADAADGAETASPAEAESADAASAGDSAQTVETAQSSDAAGAPETAPVPSDASPPAGRRSAGDEVFVPSEELEAEEEVTFPVDI